MKTIKIAKVEIVEIEVLQKELLNFITLNNAFFLHKNPTENNYFDTILIIDISQKMYFNFRSKIEKINKTFSSLNLTCSEAIILMQCCNYQMNIRNDYEKYVLQKFQNLIFQELLNLKYKNLLQ